MQLRFDWWRWLITVLAGFFILLMMYGCKTTRYVPAETVAKDTATYAHWDSVVNERVRAIRDSLLSFHWEQNERQVKDSTYIKDDVRTRVDDKGNVLGRDSVHIEIRYRELADSINIYKLQVDSLNKKLIASKSKVEYVEKDLKGWRLFYYNLGMVSFWVIILSLIAIILVLMLKKSFHRF